MQGIKLSSAKQPIPAITLKKGEALMLRTCKADGTSSVSRLVNGWVVYSIPFQWPKKGKVSCDDWNPKPICGGGLHGLLWGAGVAANLSGEADAAWLVVRIKTSDAVVVGIGKVKVPSGNVVYFGDRDTAVALIQKHAPAGTDVVYRTATAGDRGKATAGNWGTATAGYGGKATAGDRGTATAGDRGTATAGYGGTATAGDRGTATAGDRGTATAGDRGKATAGNDGKATAGDRGTATAGNWGTATAGNWGTATAGYGGTLVFHYLIGRKYQTATFEVGKDNIELNVKYRVTEKGKPYKVTE